MRRFSVAVLLILMLLTGCLSPQDIQPISCPDIVDPKILSFPWSTMTQHDLEAWVRSNYPDAVIQDRQISQDFVQLGWTAGNERYNVNFEGRVRLFYPVLSSEPTLDDLIRCYGKPAYYAMAYTQAAEAAAIRLQIWYPTLGLSFVSEEYSSWLGGLKTQFDRHTPVHSVDIVPPGTIEQVLASAELYDETVNEILSRIQPWPENFAVIKYDGDFEPTK